MENRKYKCCLCGETHSGWGNNPWPYAGDRCCDACNSMHVITARITNVKLPVLTITNSEMKLLNENNQIVFNNLSLKKVPKSTGYALFNNSTHELQEYVIVRSE